MRAMILAASLLATLPAAVAADAQPPRHGWHGRHHPHCRVVFRHGHRIRRCG